MKIKILNDAHHRINSGSSQSFRAGSEVDVPKATADALIEAGKAEAVTASPKKGS
ncbi:hypothetical protein [Pseudophaeobacter sp.]|uniref:hypothetical protein n=1 Tax=Pseudophaeobacter sp. TaxID=1971739 RepID=UPI003A96D51D